ncbi:MAG: hypothetical protein ACO3WU_11270, partial [Ilumatobacteraceae bacterium]
MASARHAGHAPRPLVARPRSEARVDLDPQDGRIRTDRSWNEHHPTAVPGDHRRETPTPWPADHRNEDHRTGDHRNEDHRTGDHRSENHQNEDHR